MHRIHISIPSDSKPPLFARGPDAVREGSGLRIRVGNRDETTMALGRDHPLFDPWWSVEQGRHAIGSALSERSDNELLAAYYWGPE